MAGLPFTKSLFPGAESRRFIHVLSSELHMQAKSVYKGLINMDLMNCSRFLARRLDS